MGKGKTGAIRQQALSKADFNAAERHGKRLDQMGPSRRVRDADPLVYGSLDLVEARAKHMEGVTQQGQTEAIHMLVQFPTDLKGVDLERNQRAMLNHAVKFANEYHGGDAVFAARLDRDEKGQHTVDVFLMPRHDFTYKDGRTQKRASVSKFSKERAKERFGKDDPRSQGQALQASWFEYLQRAGVKWVEPPQKKASRSKDRLEPEAYALAQDRTRLADQQAALASRLADVEAREEAILKAARIIEAARRAEGRPVAPDLVAIADRGRRRRDPDQSR